jgi:hypothetical protein
VLGIDVDRHSPDSGPLGGEDGPFGLREQRQVACCMSRSMSTPPIGRAAAAERGDLPASRRTSSIIPSRI